MSTFSRVNKPYTFGGGGGGSVKIKIWYTWYKLHQKCQMTDFCEKIDQLYVKLSLQLNVIETNQFFLHKERLNNIELDIKNGPNGIGKCQKQGSIEWKFPTISCLSCWLAITE